MTAAEAVCYAEGGGDTTVIDGLTILAESSLIQRRDGPSPDSSGRFGMLETIREFALEQLAMAGETSDLHRRHAAAFLDLAETAELHLRGPDQRSWLDSLDAEHDNLRAALAWAAVADPNDLAARFIHALYWFWYKRGYLGEARGRVDTILARSDAERSTSVRARALLAAGRVYWEVKDRGTALPIIETSIAMARALGDVGSTAEALCIAGMIRHELSGGDTLRLLDEAVRLYRELDDPWGLALALADLGVVITSLDVPAAHACFCESLALWRRQGDGWGLAVTAQMYAPLLLQEERYGEARTLFEEALAAAMNLGGQVVVPELLRSLSHVAQAEGNEDQALRYAEEALVISRERVDRAETARALTRLGNLALARRNLARAKEHFAAGLALYREEGDHPNLCLSLLELGVLACLEGDLTGAEEPLRESVALSRSTGSLPLVAAGLDATAVLRHARGQTVPAARLLGAAQNLRQRGGFGREHWFNLHEQGVLLYGTSFASRGSFGLGRQVHTPYERTLNAVWAALGEDAFAAAYEEDRALSLDEAVALALEQASGGDSAPVAVRALPDGLTAREVEVLRLIAAGRSNAAVAEALVLSINTVERHVTHILQKTGAANRTEAAAYAARHGLTG